MSAADTLSHALNITPCPAGQSVRDRDRIRCLRGEDILCSIGRERHVVRHTPIFRQGEPATHFFRVESGAIRRCRVMADGRRQVTGLYFPGDVFALGDSRVYLDDAEAISDTLLMQVSHADLERLDISGSCLAQRLLGHTRRELSNAQELLVMVGRASVRQRMAWFLVTRADRLGFVGGLMPVFELPMARSDIADHLGLTVETVSRILGELKREEVIAVLTSQKIAICDEHALREMTEDLSSAMPECGFQHSFVHA